MYTKLLYLVLVFSISFYNKVLVSNGKSLLINSKKNNQYYRYRLDKTPLSLILDKRFIISKLSQLRENTDYPFYYAFAPKRYLPCPASSCSCFVQGRKH